MRVFAATLLIVVLAAGSLCAQVQNRLMDKPVYERKATVAADGTLKPGSQERFGTMVLKSTKTHKTPWWSASNDWSVTGVVDWGYIWKFDTNNLPDEAIDGFLFNYVSNEVSTDGMTWAFFFWDQATGWVDTMKVQQWGSVFSGMPNHAFSPQTWFATGWTFTFDLAAGNQSLEFLMDKGDENTKINDGVEFGFFNMSSDWVSPNPPVVPYWGFTLAKPDGTMSDSNFAQNPSVYSRYSWNGGNMSYLGSFWFGGYCPAANATWALYAGGPPTNTKYTGIGQLTGNQAGLYATGDWAIGGNCHIMLRCNGMPQQASLTACLKTDPTYYSGLDFFRIFPIPIPWRQVMSAPANGVGDFAVYDFTGISSKIATKSIYFQGLITDKFNGGGTTPIDASMNVVKTN